MKKETVNKILADHGMHPAMEVTPFFIRLLGESYNSTTEQYEQKDNYIPNTKSALMTWLGY